MAEGISYTTDTNLFPILEKLNSSITYTEVHKMRKVFLCYCTKEKMFKNDLETNYKDMVNCTTISQAQKYHSDSLPKRCTTLQKQPSDE